MSENDTPRAEHVIPAGFRPIQWPHVVDLERQVSTDDEPMIVAQGDLRNTAEALGSMELLAAILKRSTPGGSPIAEQLEGMARFWKQHVRLVGGIGAAFVMAVGVLAAGVVSPATAAAATVPASVSAVEAPQPDPAPAKDRTAFGRGTWLDLGLGDLAVSAPLRELVPSCGWLPSPWSTVQVQEFSTKRGRWVLRKTLTTNSRGVAAGTVHLGGGVHTLRVVHPGSPWTLPTTGSTRRVDVGDESLDII